MLRFVTGFFVAAIAVPFASVPAQEAQTQASPADPIEITPPPPPAPAAPSGTSAQAPPAASEAPVTVPAPTAPVVETNGQASAGSAATMERASGRAAPSAGSQAVAEGRAEIAPRSAAKSLEAPAPAAPALASTDENLPRSEPPLAAAPADPAPVAGEQREEKSPPLLLPAALVSGAGVALFLCARRRWRLRKRAPEEYPLSPAPTASAAPEPHATTPEIAGTAVPAPAVPVPADRPWIDLRLRPVRAGVGPDHARVEFELCVDNKGSAPAEDVRISTFMRASAAPEAAEVERMLVDPPAEAHLPAPIDPGDSKRIAAAVALPRSELKDSVLPVVVANARYRLPDGSEGRTSASYAVGVPDGEELVMFDVDNPSGLHDGVEARLHGTSKRD